MDTGILLIDDDEDDIIFLRESLLQSGFRSSIDAVLSGPEAFHFLNERKEMLPSLIILDLNMPEMNGIEVLEKLQSDYSIPVIVYTTSCTDEIINEVKSRGAIDCLKKGTSYFDNLKFAAHVVQLLRSF